MKKGECTLYNKTACRSHVHRGARHLCSAHEVQKEQDRELRAAGEQWGPNL